MLARGEAYRLIPRERSALPAPRLLCLFPLLD